MQVHPPYIKCMSLKSAHCKYCATVFIVVMTYSSVKLEECVKNITELQNCPVSHKDCKSNNSNVNPRYAMSVQCKQGHKSQSKSARLVQGQEACSLFPVVSNSWMKALLIQKYLAGIMNITSLQ